MISDTSECHKLFTSISGLSSGFCGGSKFNLIWVFLRMIDTFFWILNNSSCGSGALVMTDHWWCHDHSMSWCRTRAQLMCRCRTNFVPGQLQLTNWATSIPLSSNTPAPTLLLQTQCCFLLYFYLFTSVLSSHLFIISPLFELCHKMIDYNLKILDLHHLQYHFLNIQ